METKTCPNCEQKIDINLKVCNYCNRKIDYGVFAVPKIDKFTYRIFGGGSLFLFLYSLGTFLTYNQVDSGKGFLGIIGIIGFGSLFIFFSMKRLRDIGRDIRLAILLVIPFLNIILFLILSTKGSKKK